MVESVVPHPQSQAAALRLAILLAGTGTLHFATPKPFDAIVPPALPGRARYYTYASGVAELAVAGALAVPRTRRVGGLAAAAVFVAVFPANVQMAADWLRRTDLPSVAKVAAVARLPLQVPLVTQALAASRRAPHRL
ncbi:MAG TPA: hypothetical protein VIW24_16765 [Aldersonia sp.]